MAWSAVSSLNTPREGLAVANGTAPSPQSGSRIYAFGGNDDLNNLIAAVEAYDPAQNSWTVVPGTALPTPRQYLAATAANGMIHTVGGTDGSGQPVGTHEIYDPATGAWSTGTPLETARSGLAAVTGPDGLIYAIGGVADAGGNPAYLGTVEVYDPATGTAGAWAPGPAMPTARENLSACVLGGLIYAIGGDAPGGLGTVEVLDPVAQMWRTLPPLPALPAVRTSLAASAGPDGLIYAIGGMNDPVAAGLATVYGYDPSSPMTPWSVQPPLQTPQARLAGGTGPDGRMYAIGGRNVDKAGTTVEVLDAAQPDVYIGNGTYQSPDIILLDSAGNPVPLGGVPTYDTLLHPNTDYPIQAVVHNDSAVPAPYTAVRFWHFPGGVGSAGTLIDVQYVTVPAAGMIMVSSASPFHSAGYGQHECVAVSVANYQSPYFNVDPTTATEVVDPTVPQPAGSGHFGSAWRNTDSMLVSPGMGWHLGFAAALRTPGPVAVGIEVAAAKVPLGWDRTGDAATLRKTLQFTGAQARVPLFLVPAIRSGFRAADDLGVEVRRSGEDRAVRLPAGEHHHLTVSPGQTVRFTVSGKIPLDAHPGDVYLVDVGAHYPPSPARAASTVRFLEVIYVEEGTP